MKLFKDDFFITVSGELYSDFEDQKVTPSMACVYLMILRQVDFETGVWWGTAYRIQNGWGRQMHLRTVQNDLKKLSDAGYLKSFHINGRRLDYAVVIDRYPIRFGKWKGHRVNAAATTDPNNAVYVRDLEGDSATTASPTAQRPRNDHDDPESSVNRQRIVSESSASPNARNAPDVPDVPDEPDPPATTTAKPAVAVGSTTSSVKPTPTPNGYVSSSNDCDAFMGKLRLIWENRRGGVHQFAATKEHINRAFAMAREQGIDVFLAAWNHWLTTCQPELRLGQHELPPKPSKAEFRAWPLDHFLSSGAAAVHVEKVRPYAHVTQGEVLAFLVCAQGNGGIPIETTSEQIETLAAFILDERYDYEPKILAYAYQEFVHTGGNNMADFITDITKKTEAQWAMAE